MASEASEHEVPAPPTHGASRHWAGPDLIVGSALIVLLISLFLPWFDGFSAMTGPAAHGYLWLVFALTIFALAVLVGRESIDRLPGNWPSVRQMLIGATGLALALSIRGLVMRPTLGFDGNAGGYLVAQQSYGGLICVLAAATALFAATRANRTRSATSL